MKSNYTSGANLFPFKNYNPFEIYHIYSVSDDYILHFTRLVKYYKIWREFLQNQHMTWEFTWNDVYADRTKQWNI